MSCSIRKGAVVETGSGARPGMEKLSERGSTCRCFKLGHKITQCFEVEAFFFAFYGIEKQKLWEKDLADFLAELFGRTQRSIQFGDSCSFALFDTPYLYIGVRGFLSFKFCRSVEMDIKKSRTLWARLF